MHAAVWHADIRHSPVATTVFADLWYRSQFHPNGFVCMLSLNQELKILRNDSAGLVKSYLSPGERSFQNARGCKTRRYTVHDCNRINIPQNAEEFVSKIARLILTANCVFVFQQKRF